MSYKVLNVQNIEQYPENYDWLDEEQQIKIISYMNGVQDLADRYYESYLEDLVTSEEEEKYLRLYNHTLTSLTGSKNAYATLDIMVEYDWPNHKGKWFLAVKTDAQTYNDFQETETNDEIQESLNSVLLSYGDVGI